jgi:tetratricopeptide (TPR) repeat protein
MCYNRSLELSPARANVQTDLGVALVDSGRLDEGMEHYRKALEIDPRYVEAHHNMALALVRQERVDEAVEHWEKALQIQPGYYEAHNCLGIACLRKGDVAGAIAHWRKVLHFSPSYTAVQKNLAWLLAAAPDASLRDGARAVELAQQADRASGGANPEVLGTLAAAYAEAGRFSDAADAARRALALVPQNDPGQAADLREQLALYEAGRPYRDPGLVSAAAKN